MLLKSLRIISHQLFYLTAVVTILLLLGLLAALWVSEEIAERKDELAVWVGEQIGHPVKVGEAGLYLFDWVPKLEVSQIVVASDTDTDLVSLGRVYLGLDILASIERRAPVIQSIELDGVTLNLHRDNDGNISLAGIESSSTMNASDMQGIRNVSNWLSDIRLSQVRVIYEDEINPHFSDTYVIHQAEIEAAKEEWSIIGSVGAETLWPRLTDITMKAVLADEQLALESWHLSVQVEAIPLISMLANTSVYGAALTSGSLTANVEVSHRQDHTKGTLALALDDVELRSIKQADKTAVLSRLAGQFQWYQSVNGWTLDAEDVEVQFNEAAWPLSPWHISSQATAKTTVTTDYLNLTDISTFLTIFDGLPLPIQQIQPAGILEDIQVSFSENSLESLTAQGRELGAFPYQSFPGFNNLNAKIAIQADQGAVVFDTRKATVFAPAWLEESVSLDTASGAVSWHMNEANWHVFVQDLRVLNPHMDITLNGRINRQHQLLDSDLTLVVNDFEVNQWQRYVPVGLRPDDFSRWSERAFKSGRLTDGRLKIQGELSAFPFDKEPTKGTFTWHALVDGAELLYADDWPMISELTARLSGTGNQLNIESSVGKIAGFDFERVKVAIPNLIRSDPFIQVNGKLLGSTEQAFNFLNNSPLKARFGSVTEWVKVSGKSDIELDLMVPLVRVDDTDVSGSVGFNQSQLLINNLPEVTVSAIQGRLAFSNEGVEANDIKGQAFNAPVSIEVIPENKQTRVAVKGQAEVTELRQRWPALFPSFISGETDYLTQLFIREPERGAFDLQLSVDSDLRGMTIDAPSPVGKLAHESSDFQLSIQVDEPLRYDWSYKEWISAAFSVQDERLLGEISVGGKQAVYSASPLTVVGVLAELNMDTWLDWQNQLTSTNGGVNDVIHKVMFDVEKLRLAGQTLDKARLIARPYTNGWQYELDSWQIAGRVQVPYTPTNDDPVQANLTRCYLVLPEEGSEKTKQTSASLWPPIDLVISDFAIDNTQLGLLTLNARQQGERWALEKANILSPTITAEFNGHWRKSNESSTSEINVIAESTNLNELLSYYGYQEVAEAKSVVLQGDLSWLGSPADFSLHTIKGHLDMLVGQGRLIELQPGAAGRVFGLLSITALPRRLALDFSDFFGKGFGFSSIQGRFEFNDGLATTQNLLMKGDSADIAIKGPIDLVNKTYNQTVTVTPKVSSTLPLAGAMAGGPVGLGVGTAILLVDKIAGKIFDREIVNVITYRYGLTGPWDNPDLKVRTTPAEQ
jgi:uncharacterized protein (TIGR02099 family)